MSLDLLLGIAGTAVTLMVVVAMVLVAPRNVERGARATADVDPEPRPTGRARAGRRGSAPSRPR